MRRNCLTPLTPEPLIYEKPDLYGGRGTAWNDDGTGFRNELKEDEDVNAVCVN